MKDEEKAEEYLNKRPFIHLLGRNTFVIRKEFKDAILWAFAEGRKEVTYMTAEEYGKTLDKCKECHLDMVKKFSKKK